jgi:uncharacterized membrane protein
MTDDTTIIHEVKQSPWKLGFVYADGSDPRLVVRQRTGLGWTLNFGQPLSWVVLGVLVAFVLARRLR